MSCNACSCEAEIGTEENPHPIPERFHSCMGGHRELATVEPEALRAVREWQALGEAKKMSTTSMPWQMLRMLDVLATTTILDVRDALPLLRAAYKWRSFAQGIESRGPLVRALIAALDELTPEWRVLVEDDEADASRRESAPSKGDEG